MKVHGLSGNLILRPCSSRIAYDSRNRAKPRQFRSGPIDFAVAHSSHKISSRSSSVTYLQEYEFPHDAGGDRRNGLRAVQLFYRISKRQRPERFLSSVKYRDLLISIADQRPLWNANGSMSASSGMEIRRKPSFV